MFKFIFKVGNNFIPQIIRMLGFLLVYKEDGIILLIGNSLHQMVTFGIYLFYCKIVEI